MHRAKTRYTFFLVTVTLAAAALALSSCGEAGPPPLTSTDLPRVSHTLDVGGAPHGIRFSNDGDTAYVALSGDGQIAVVDLATMTVARKLPAGETPLDLFALADGGWLVTQFRDSTLIRVGSGGPEGSPQNVGPGPSLFAPEARRNRQYVTSEFTDRLTVVDAASGEELAVLATGDRPYPADVTRDGSLAFVPSLGDGKVTVIDLLAGQTVTQVEVCEGPAGGALTADEVSYIVACGGSDELVFLNTASFRITKRIREQIGPRPFSVAATSDSRFAFSNNAGGSTVSVVGLGTNEVVGVLEVGDQPIVVRVHPDGRRIFVANELSGTVSVVEVPPAPPVEKGQAVNQVVVLGMIHGQHRTSSIYGTQVLEDLIREIDPDVVLTEISPNRFDAAVEGFTATGAITEPRVVRFPEYVDVLFPLTKEMDFEIVPTAGWNLTMSDYRAARLASIPDDPAWAERWKEYQAAIAESDRALSAGGASDDPRWIHTDAYDAAQDLRLSVYDRLFNEALGPGGWDYINRAHYRLIEQALDARSGRGIRVLITYGAGHKVWFMKALRERDDIELLDVAPFLDAIGS